MSDALTNLINGFWYLSKCLGYATIMHMFIKFKIAARYPKTTFWTLTIYFFTINAKPLVIFTVRLCPLFFRGFLATTSYKEIVSKRSPVDNFFPGKAFRCHWPLHLYLIKTFPLDQLFSAVWAPMIGKAVTIELVL